MKFCLLCDLCCRTFLRKTKPQKYQIIPIYDFIFTNTRPGVRSLWGLNDQTHLNVQVNTYISLSLNNIRKRKVCRIFPFWCINIYVYIYWSLFFYILGLNKVWRKRQKRFCTHRHYFYTFSSGISGDPKQWARMQSQCQQVNLSKSKDIV